MTASAGIGGSCVRRLTDDRRQPVLDPAAEQHHAAEHRQRGQHDQRERHHRGRLVRVHVLLPALLAEEGHQHQPGHVEAGDAGAEHGADARPPSSRSSATSMILSFDQKPEKPGNPMIAR